MRLCTTCGILKEIDAFHNYAKGPGGKAYRCKLCDSAARKAYQLRQDPEKKRAMARNRMMRAKYGIEPEDFENMNTRCGGLCEICGGEPTTYQGFKTLCVDHCHTTGKVRGLLCNKCNQALGLFQDSIENLLSAVEYLKERSEIH